MFATDLPDRLEEFLTRHHAAHLPRPKCAPQLSYGRHSGPAAPNARAASVLLMLFQRNGQWRLPLTVRQSNLPKHPGQISLPGGMIQSDETSCQGALRELEEEVGIPAGRVKLLGSLSPVYVFNSNFNVVPWVGALSETPTFTHDPREVAELFELPLTALFDANCRDQMEIVRGALRFSAPCIRWNRFAIWGATHLILAQFLGVLEQMETIPDEPGP